MGRMAILDSLRCKITPKGSKLAWAFVLILLIPLSDTHPNRVQAAYEYVHQLFLHGHLIESQRESEQEYRHFLNSDPEWAAKFQLLEARTLVFRGMNNEALRLLAELSSLPGDREEIIEKTTLEGVAYTYLHRFAEAERKLLEVSSFCRPAIYDGCGHAFLARGILALERGQLDDARQFDLDSLTFARAHHDRRTEESSFQNLGQEALQAERYDEALDWSRAAYRIATGSGWEDQAALAQGNQGWAYFALGDKEKGLELFLASEKAAEKTGNRRIQLKWLENIGYVYQDQGDSARAAAPYNQALELATRIDSKQDLAITLQDLAYASVDAGRLEEASAYLDRLDPLVKASGNQGDAAIGRMVRAEIAAARHQDRQAEELFRSVESDPESQSSLRLGAEHRIARLYDSQGRTADAEQMYRTTLTTFESERAQLHQEDSRLPFLANATPIYDDYIRLLIRQGKAEQALAAADQSRARTLAQGLGLTPAHQAFHPAPLHPTQIAQKTGATLLFYWLGPKQSWLWAITPQKTALFPLPPQAEIAADAERYRKALLEAQDPLAAANAPANRDGRALYSMLVAPAQSLLHPNAPVVILADGALSQLNFETLLAPGPGQEPGAAFHYFIDDATLISAPSLSMLAAATPAVNRSGKLLLMGDAVSSSPDYPELPLASLEMKLIRKHFAAADQAAYARAEASPAAYLRSAPRQFSYIHFVAHGTASRTDPLDSAIILSPNSAADDSFKLYARDIIQSPIAARLVTISACNGSGVRSYAGEGLVGLSWAFLRAGAHNVIGALWDVSDNSTPRLMNSLYQGLQEGRPPSSALRRAKLALLHSQGPFRKPFFWAPFQLYSAH